MENTNQEVIVETESVVSEELAVPTKYEEVPPVAEEEKEAPTAEEQPAEEEQPVVEEQPAEEPAAEEEPATEEPSVPAEPTEDYAAMYNDLQAQYEALTEELNNLRTQYETLETEKNELMSQYEELKNLNEQYSADITAKETTIASYEAEEKERLIQKFSGKIPADIMQQIEEAKDTMSINEMNTRFALEYTSFSMAKEQNEEIRVPQLPQEEPSALARILNKYKR